MTNPKNRIWFDDETHSYYADKEHSLRIPNYSSIMETVFGNKFEHVPFDVLENKRIIGTEIHKITENYDKNVKIGTIPDEYAGYLAQWIRFCHDFGIADKPFDVVEEPMFSMNYWYAGTVDRVINNTIIDIKTGNPYKDHRLQTVAYALLASECLDIKIEKRMCVYLTDSTYKTVIHDKAEDLDYWLGVLEVFKWKMFKK